jgi:hypothetical protein
MKGPIIWDCHWNEIQEQDWPDQVGAIFVLKLHSTNEHAKQWGVFEWVESEVDHVMNLGEFWKKEEALIFANAKCSS